MQCKSVITLTRHLTCKRYPTPVHLDICRCVLPSHFPWLHPHPHPPFIPQTGLQCSQCQSHRIPKVAKRQSRPVNEIIDFDVCGWRCHLHHHFSYLQLQDEGGAASNFALNAATSATTSLVCTCETEVMPRTRQKGGGPPTLPTALGLKLYYNAHEYFVTHWLVTTHQDPNRYF